jgi:hypothetical protein
MQRVRGQFVVPVGTPPTYDDPTNPLTYDPGHFNKDPLQAPTALTPDWANMVQQELCNLVENLGGTLDGEADDQLAALIVPIQNGAHGNRTDIWIPVSGAFVNCAWSDTNSLIVPTAAPWSVAMQLNGYTVGDRLKTISVGLFRSSGTGLITSRLRRGLVGGSPATVANVGPTANTTPQFYSIGLTGLPGGGYTVNTSESIWIFTDGASTNDRVSFVMVTYDHPP